jgi:hypothetical protein
MLKIEKITRLTVVSEPAAVTFSSVYQIPDVLKAHFLDFLAKTVKNSTDIADGRCEQVAVRLAAVLEACLKQWPMATRTTVGGLLEWNN